MAQSINNNNNTTLITCGFCSAPCSSFCSNCKSIAYCNKQHQKLHRKVHKLNCFPIKLKIDTTFGKVLTTTRDVAAGEILFTEKSLVVGPRANFNHFIYICLGCCKELNIDNKFSYKCTSCKWPMCSSTCENASIHKHYECPILTKTQVNVATTQEEYLAITILRCLLLQTLDPVKWEQLLTFESHTESRSTKSLAIQQVQSIYNFLKDKCQINTKEWDFKLVDWIYGVIVVNGYGDANSCSVKLYSKASKLTNACVPNTRTKFESNSNTLQIISTIEIKSECILTQLYGKIFKGTFDRQQLFQNIYYFTCHCARCIDATELGTYFSAIKCNNELKTSKKKNKNNKDKKCTGYLLPKSPLNLNTNWNCNVCSNIKSYSQTVLPALTKIQDEIGNDLNLDDLYSEFEVYSSSNENDSNPTVVALDSEVVEDVFVSKLSHVQDMIIKLEKCEQEIVHTNHYGLLPLKTALVATIHTLLVNYSRNTNYKKYKQSLADKLFGKYQVLVEELLGVVDTFCPGLTSQRGILLFYKAEGIKYSTLLQENDSCSFNCNNKNIGSSNFNNQKLMGILQDECKRIMLLQDENDSQRQLVFKYLS